jgi:hypothetical protein
VGFADALNPWASYRTDPVWFCPGHRRGHHPTHHTRGAQIRTQRPGAVVTEVLRELSAQYRKYRSPRPAPIPLG